MPAWQWVADAAGAVLVLVLLYGVCLVIRRRWINHHGGTFEFSVRVRPQRAGRGWVLGLGRYSEDQLEWFRVFSILPKPKLILHRAEVSYEGRREPEGPETYSLYAGHVIIQCRTPMGLIEVAMSQDALTGFLSWLESGPPGQGPRGR
ncbi:MAG TPA: DUF2550 domain-containing protein [Nocardioidaceae bacterium]|nr:DUF2550 domain-containing protein [Nocardioidaceae bacterium]